MILWLSGWADSRGGSSAVEQPHAGAAGLEPSSLWVCVYSQDTGVPVPLWSGREDSAAAREYLDAVARPRRERLGRAAAVREPRCLGHHAIRAYVVAPRHAAAGVALHFRSPTA